MKRFFFVLIAAFIFLPFNIKAQNTISLDLLQDLSSIDPGTFIFTNNLSGQPTIFRVTIITNPVGKKVIVEGRVDWKENFLTSYKRLVYFQTEPFVGRSFTNDEIGNSDIKIKTVEGDKDLGKDLATRGKPVGVFGITLRMFDERGVFLGDTYKEILFLNPTPPSLNLPVSPPYEVTVGNAQISWTPVFGVLRYKVKACIIDGSQGLQAALDAGNPVVDEDVGSVVSINLFDSRFKKREVVGGQKLAVIVSAIVSQSGRELELKSEPREIKVSETMSSGSNANSNIVNPDLLRLADLITGQVSQDFVDKLKNGQITVDQIHITDENGQTISLAEFSPILTYLSTYRESITKINFTAQ